MMNVIKRYKKAWLYGAICLTMGLASGCESNIDLQPQGIITAEGYFKSEDDFEKALNGLYDRFHYDNYSFWMDGVTDNGLINQSWNWGYDLSLGNGSPSSSFSTDKWKRSYISIQRANNVINQIDRYAWPQGETDANRNRILGEAKTVRAFFYLDLLGSYGRIQFYLENPASVADSKNLKQVEDMKPVYDFLLNDLKEAIEGLPEKAAHKFRIGKPAARMLRARMAAYAAGYLKDKTYYGITLEETALLIASAPPLGDYGSLFRDGCEDMEEVILAKGYTMDKKNGWGNWYNQSINGYCVTVPTQSMVDAYEYLEPRDEKLPYLHKDPRLYASIYVPGMKLRDRYYNTIPDNIVTKDGKSYFDPAKEYGALQDAPVSVGDALGEGGGSEWNKTCSGFTWKKYCQGQETWSTFNSFIIFRYAEAYLLRAEALAETNGDMTEAKALVKVIRDRAGNTNDIDEAVKQLYGGSLLNLIRNEARVEFAHEGLRFFDIRRWDILLDVMNKPIGGIEYYEDTDKGRVKKVLVPAVRTPYTSKDFWWPIPQEEIDVNEGRLTQNKDW